MKYQQQSDVVSRDTTYACHVLYRILYCKHHIFFMPDYVL